MNNLGLMVVAIGVIYLFLSVIFKNKVNIYNEGKYTDLLNKREFLKLQLIISVINSTCAILYGLAAYINNLSNLYIVFYPIIFQAINYLTILISRRMQYIK